MLTAHPDLRFPVPDEKAVQRQLLRTLSLAGWRIGSTSQYRASRVLQGLPDLVGWHLGIRRFLWWETKALMPRWREREVDPWTYYNPYDRRTWRSKPLRPEQEEFRVAALACGELHGWGGVIELENFVIDQEQGYRLPAGHFQLGGRRIG